MISLVIVIMKECKLPLCGVQGKPHITDMSSTSKQGDISLCNIHLHNLFNNYVPLFKIHMYILLVYHYLSPVKSI